jgi:hypothetical protein
MYEQIDTVYPSSNMKKTPDMGPCCADWHVCFVKFFGMKKQAWYLSTGPSQGNCSKRSTRGRHAGDSARAASYATTAATMSWCSDAKSSGVGALRRKCPLERGNQKKQKPPHICNMREMASIKKPGGESCVYYQITDNNCEKN